MVNGGCYSRRCAVLVETSVQQPSQESGSLQPGESLYPKGRPRATSAPLYSHSKRRPLSQPLGSAQLFAAFTRRCASGTANFWGCPAPARAFCTRHMHEQHCLRNGPQGVPQDLRGIQCICPARHVLRSPSWGSTRRSCGCPATESRSMELIRPASVELPASFRRVVVTELIR